MVDRCLFFKKYFIRVFSLYKIDERWASSNTPRGGGDTGCPPLLTLDPTLHWGLPGVRKGEGLGLGRSSGSAQTRASSPLAWAF